MSRPARATARRLLALGLVASLGSAAVADTDYFATRPDAVGVAVRAHPPRTRGQQLLIGGLAAGALVTLGAGVGFNLAAIDARDGISASKPKDVPWTDATQASYDRARRDGVIAGVFYGAGGLLLIGALVAYWRTEPPERMVSVRPAPVVAPTPGGAVLGAGWSF